MIERSGFSRTVIAAVLALALLACIAMVVVERDAIGPSGLAFTLLVIGLLGAMRWLVGAGVLALAAASAVATFERPLPLALALNAAIALVCVAVLVGADLSFTTRRDPTISGVTIRGLISTHVVVSLTGVVSAVVLLSGALAVDWPDWLVVLPLIALAITAVAAAVALVRYRRSARPMPPPPSRRPPPPPPSWAPAAKSNRHFF